MIHLFHLSLAVSLGTSRWRLYVSFSHCISLSSCTSCVIGADMPVYSPLKAVMTGAELLIDRSQLWEQSAAKHVTIASHIEKLLTLARRWRQFELTAWRLLSQRVKASAEEGNLCFRWHTLSGKGDWLLLAPSSRSGVLICMTKCGDVSLRNRQRSCGAFWSGPRCCDHLKLSPCLKNCTSRERLTNLTLDQDLFLIR